MHTHKLDIGRFWQHLERFKEEQISALCVAVDGQLAGLVGYSDAIRKESAATVQKLKANGRRKLVLLSGDSQSAVKAVARAVRVDEAIGSLLPDEKAEYVKKLRAEGHVVAMVGDGINDAPALALADVGISIAGSSEVAVETADVVLLEGGLLQLAEAFTVSDRAMASVRRNLGVIIAPNAAAILLGALGLITPPLAAIINNGATLLSVLIGAAPLATTPVRRAWNRRQRERAVRKQIHATSLTAATACAVLSPVPMADEMALFFLHLELSRRIGSQHGLPVRRIPWRPILRTALNGLLARAVVQLPTTWVPGVAAVVSSTTGAALTELLGHYVDGVCRAPLQARAIKLKDFALEMRRILRIARSLPQAKASARTAAPTSNLTSVSQSLPLRNS
jgi:soluble P-type ATPase/uncharacterized protein (DUF697 family)